MPEAMIKNVTKTMTESIGDTMIETEAEACICRSTLPYSAGDIFTLFADEKNAAFLDSSLENNLGSIFHHRSRTLSRGKS